MREEYTQIIEQQKIQIKILFDALLKCNHETDSMRVWGSSEWKYHPYQAGRIAQISREALDSKILLDRK